MKITRLVLILCIGFLLTQNTMAAESAPIDEYMQVLVVYKGFKTTIFTISVSGEIITQKTNSVSDGFSVRPDKVANIHLEIQMLLNQFAKEGWVLKQISNLSGEGVITVSYYLAKTVEE